MRIAADGVDMPADRGLVEEPGEAAIDDEEHERAHRNGAERTEPRDRDLLGAKEAHRVGEAGDRPPVRDEIGEAAGDVERAERHDERMRQAEKGQAEAIDDAAGEPDRRPEEDGDRPGHPGDVGHGEAHHGERQDRTDREVDAGGQDHQEHPDGEERVHRDLLQDVGEILHRQEIFGLQCVESDHHRDHDDNDAVALDAAGDALVIGEERLRDHLSRPDRGREPRYGPWCP